MPNHDHNQAELLLDELAAQIRHEFVGDRTILSFQEYFQLVQTEPARHMRASAQYMVDMLNYFGQYEIVLPYGKINRFKLFDMSFGGVQTPIAGQEVVVQALYRTLANFAREGRVNKLILLHGPNGSAKSSLCRSLMAGMEAYAHTPEGAMYSFSWIFPSERLQQSDRIGFGSAGKSQAEHSSYAYLMNEYVDARIPCDMHDHPLFLIPQTARVGHLHGLLKATTPATDKPLQGNIVLSDYLRFGDLCYKCRRIFDALLTNYEGDMKKVLNHVQIERFYVSRRYRKGIATIEPQLSVDARISQVTADRSLMALPRALQHVSLFEPSGPLVDANRGLLEYSDLLKRPIDAFKYLLGTIETATVAVDSLMLHLDMVLVASTNETYLEAFKEHPDFASFKGRMELIKVPYLLHYSTEKQIYHHHVTPLAVGRHVAPHVVDVAALWAVLTRMRRNDATLYAADLAVVVDNLSPLEKLRLFDTAETPEAITTQQAKELRHAIADLYQEGQRYPHYEGRFGASAREIRSALFNAAQYGGYQCLHPLALFEELRAILAATSVYEFLRQEVNKNYHDHAAFLEQTEALYVAWIDDEICDCMGLSSQESYTDLFTRYVLHASHWVRGEKLLDQKTDVLQDADEQFMGEIEKILLSAAENKVDFRKSLIATIGARSLDNPQDELDYTQLFKPYIRRLREDFFAKRQKIVQKLMKNFLDYTGEEKIRLDAKEQSQAAAMLQAMQTRYNYCDNCARDTVAYLSKKRYS